MRDIIYFHVELDLHDIRLAEGATAESYLDTGNRAASATAGRPQVLHPDVTGVRRRPEHGACMNLSIAPHDVEPIWRTVGARAEAMGRRLNLPRATTDPNCGCTPPGARCALWRSAAIALSS